MRLLICAGGTGGGVYPALVVLQSLSGDKTGAGASVIDVLWVGGEGGMEAELVQREGIPFQTIQAAGVHGVGLRALPGNLLRLWRGLAASRRVLRQYRPQVLLFTGGYVAVPMALAARLPGLGAPRPRSLLFVPDIEPGLALKLLARFADRIAVPVEEARPYFSGRARLTVTGYPVRESLKGWDIAEARRALGLVNDLPVLLVTGGSRGARSINQALLGALPDLLGEIQVIHLAGKRDWEEVAQAQGTLSPEQSSHYHVYPFLHEQMGAALTAADLVVSRAGASSLGEYPLFGLPAVLVPYPHAWRYQRVNADYLASHGAALVLEDAELAEKFSPVVRQLMADASRRQIMARAMQSLAQPEAAGRIASLIMDLAGTPPGGLRMANYG